jgi:hypothetical protein
MYFEMNYFDTLMMYIWYVSENFFVFSLANIKIF